MGVHALLPGKKLLDEGGEAAEIGVLALQLATDAVTGDRELLIQLQRIAGLYKEAVSLFRRQPCLKGEVSDLVASYGARAAHLEEMLSDFGDSPQEPPFTAAEREAASILQMRSRRSELQTNAVEAASSAASLVPR